MEVVLYLLFFVGFGVLCLIPGMIMKKKRSTCKGCGKRYDYNQDIDWEILRTKTGAIPFGKPKAKAQVAIECHCSSCGAIKEISRWYTYAEYTEGILGNSIVEKNLEDLVRKDFL